jgi:NADPH-dependent 2,4-dienoyl-CoA reductase/sulfur reductase-like enzyme
MHCTPCRRRRRRRGGATAARYIAKDSDGAVDVTLIEPTRTYYTCFFSNLYLGGFRDYDDLGHSYGTLASHYGVNVVHDWATGVDRDAKTVRSRAGPLPYDRADPVAPGIDFIDGSVPGWDVTGAGRDAPCLQGRHADRASEGADRGDARRRHLRHGRPAQPLSLPARTL